MSYIPLLDLDLDMISIDLEDKKEQKEQKQKHARLSLLQVVLYDTYPSDIYKVSYEHHTFFVLYNRMIEKYARMVRRDITYNTYYYFQELTKNHLIQKNNGGVVWMDIKELCLYLETL